ncbi:hypothetical protein Pint_05443 [Pistacia integerrima]|uniref:Uncharacterized protein n=1 Tax=Pistacia integerrima TaxID=434235 RepID=A0ACC0Z0D0_9ROSI|nr:hypothetical protein Pint_05443 [Pistacia integerrima]
METTLNVGTIMVTFYPNFNMLLKDNALLNALKVQVQIVGEIPKTREFMATLHYQLVYRVHNHTFDLAPPRDPDLADKALFLKVNSQCTHSCTYVP